MTTTYTTKKTYAEIADVFAAMLSEDYDLLGSAYERVLYDDEPFGYSARKLARHYGLTVRDVMTYFLR